MVQERTRKWEYIQEDEDLVAKEPGWRDTHREIYVVGVGLGRSGKSSVGADSVWRREDTQHHRHALTMGSAYKEAVIYSGMGGRGTKLRASMASRRDSVSLLETDSACLLGSLAATRRCQTAGAM